MKPYFDEVMLSAYLDGELDAGLMSEAGKLIEKNEGAKRFVLDSVRTTAHLRQSMNQDLKEKVPEQLVYEIQSYKEKRVRNKSMQHPWLRIAATFLLFVIGTGLGLLMAPDSREHKMFPLKPFPARYQQVVDQALEHNLSGVPHRWDVPNKSIRVTVTPVKTYRHKTGRYYREYRLEVISQTERGQMNGLAYRSAQGRWVTTTLIL